MLISVPSGTATRAGPVTFTVTYTGATAVTLLPANVTLTKTDTANGAVAVTGTGTSTRTVTISGITGNGTLGISLAAGTASDTAGNTALAAGPSETVIVDNTPPGGSGVSGMRFSNNGTTWSVWEPFAATKAWTLLTGAGLKTVRV